MKAIELKAQFGTEAEAVEFLSDIRRRYDGHGFLHYDIKETSQYEETVWEVEYAVDYRLVCPAATPAIQFVRDWAHHNPPTEAADRLLVSRALWEAYASELEQLLPAKSETVVLLRFNNSTLIFRPSDDTTDWAIYGYVTKRESELALGPTPLVAVTGPEDVERKALNAAQDSGNQ